MKFLATTIFSLCALSSLAAHAILITETNCSDPSGQTKLMVISKLIPVADVSFMSGANKYNHIDMSQLSLRRSDKKNVSALNESGEETYLQTIEISFKDGRILSTTRDLQEIKAVKVVVFCLDRSSDDEK